MTSTSNRIRFALFCATSLTALPAAAARSFDAHRRVDATRRAGDVVIDGKLDDEGWQTAPAAGGFWQREPHEGKAASFPTEFRMLYDDDALYVAVRAHDPKPDEIRALLTRRDQDSSSDWVWVSIDSFHDRRTAFSFGLNPAGVQRDFLIYDDVEQDDAWDAVWQGAATIDSDGWAAELRIPYSQLRFSDESDCWGLQIGRLVQRTHEESYWVPWPKQSAGRVSKFGALDGLHGIEATGSLEVVPFAVLGGSIEPAVNSEPSALGDIGIDARYRLTSDFVLSATVNPDFGQVEADPSDVNLTAGETFFPEKRPFFLEGADLFRFRLSQGDGDDSVEQLFYSRRIGGTPHGESEDGIIGRTPKHTTIYGATKLTGKTAGGWSLGALNAITAEEGVDLRGGGTRTLEPLASYSVLSLRKDLNEGRTHVGLAATGVHRALDGTGLDLHAQAYAGGLNVSHRFWDDEWLLQAKLLGSSVLGSSEALAETQEASQHYYQRPDADHLRFDRTRTSLHGFGAQYMVGKIGGGPLRGAIGGDTRSPGFEVNDLGFQRSADYAVQWLWLQYRDDEPGTVLRDWSINTNGWGVLDYGGELLATGGNINAHARLLSYWRGSLGVSRSQDRWDTGALRGGPAIRATPGWGLWSSVTSDARRAVQGNIGAIARLYDEGGSYRVQLSSELSVQARSNLELAIAPFWTRNVDDLQFVDTVDDHYVIGHIDQHTLGATLRVSYTVSPTLSVQLYAQPFVSSGSYDAYREVTRPRAERYEERFTAVDLDDFNLDNPEFSFRELRSNLVVRWEYLPGSTLFVVWSHARTSEDAVGRFDLGSDLGALADEPGEHVVLVKLTYRFEA